MRTTLLDVNLVPSRRTISDYCSAYNAISLPFMLPIPSSEPTDNPSVPILIDERAKANRAPSNKTKKKSGTSELTFRASRFSC